MGILNDIIEANAIANDALRDVFFPEGTNLVLLKISDTTNAYETIETVLSGWYLEYSEYRQMFRLAIAVNNADFNGKVVTATHVSVGDYVYLISNGDTIPPQGEEPFWKLYCTRFQGKGNFRGVR